MPKMPEVVVTQLCATQNSHKFTNNTKVNKKGEKKMGEKEKETKNRIRSFINQLKTYRTRSKYRKLGRKTN